ncbi:hypothetical protein FCV25MIE_08557 [Fagus crenata]
MGNSNFRQLCAEVVTPESVEVVLEVTLRKATFWKNIETTIATDSDDDATEGGEDDVDSRTKAAEAKLMLEELVRKFKEESHTHSEVDMRVHGNKIILNSGL